MASVLLILRLTTAMAAMAHTATASVLLMLRLTTAMAATDLTDMARGPLMLTTDMAVMAHTDMASRLRTYSKREDTSGINQNYTLKPTVPRTDMIREFCNLLNETKIKLYTSW